ncbi:MAG: hypothetical protein JSS86_19435 [Cyanobacteria bacterium SZAS LIN-2]|nr:hypothetical protein [Cyanobacteria bacterium SZAS LIN-3]MBS1998511.1 hypothetical protein [Cyanobacteria bacterium SZAS LIN-2]
MSTEIQADLHLEAATVLDKLETFVSGKRRCADLGDDDSVWLSRWAALLGLDKTDEFLLNVGGQDVNLLDPHTLRQAPDADKLLEKLYYSLRAMTAAYKAGGEPLVVTTGDFGSVGSFISAETSARVVIHNRSVAEKLKTEYDRASFNALFELCRSNKVFALKVNDVNGLVTTAEAEENWEMSGRQWVTDTVRCGDIERTLNPQGWRKALITLCDFYSQDEEMAAMASSIADPEYYRAGGLLNGVAHIFLPKTLRRDTSWFNNKRLESHGLALRAICETVVVPADWAFSAAELGTCGGTIAQTIVCLASYLKSINTDKNGRFDFAAPSAGPWEEIPFPEGLTWDTEAIRSGFEALKDLLFNPAYTSNPSIVAVREKILAHQYGDWLKDTRVLDQLLRQARGKIIDRLFGGTLPVESPHRPLDCSLAFISTSTITFAEDVVSDVLMHFQLMQVLEERLVRAHGIIRYAPFSLTMEDGRKESVFDAYLADNYWLEPDLRRLVTGLGEKSASRDFGSSDCSTHDDYVTRVKTARAGTEAQWCFVSVMAEAYCRQVLKLQRALAGMEKGEKLNEQQAEMAKLISFGTGKAAEYLNRSFARITPEGAVKANGRDCPPWAIPEAYEMVSPIGPRRASDVGAVAGANTPLAWGQASLYSACELFRCVLEA